MLNSVFAAFPAFSILIIYTLIITITLEIEFNISFTLASDLADICIGTEDIQSQFKLPEHDEYFIYYDSKTYKRGKIRPVKRRDKSPNI